VNKLVIFVLPSLTSPETNLFLDLLLSAAPIEAHVGAIVVRNRLYVSTFKDLTPLFIYRIHQTPVLLWQFQLEFSKT
jgi:hypothetical protein